MITIIVKKSITTYCIINIIAELFSKRFSTITLCPNNFHANLKLLSQDSVTTKQRLFTAKLIYDTITP